MSWAAILRKPGFRQFVIHTVAFAALFILISFIIGQGVVIGPLLYDLHFQYYGGLGYVLLVMTVFFVVYTREKLFAIKPVRWGHWIFWITTVLFTAAFKALTDYLDANRAMVQPYWWHWFAATHLTFLAIFLSLGLAMFDIASIKDFAKRFRKELLICFAIGMAFYASMRIVWLSWEYLSNGVAQLVHWMLLLTFDDVVFFAPRRLFVEGFMVTIGEACSGVFSIFLFTCLYLLIIALDWKKLNHTKAMLMFPVTVAGLFFVNVLRVYSILLVGVFYDQVFAISLFHSYIGMVLFLVYFIAFMWLCYDWMLAKPKTLAPHGRAKK